MESSASESAFFLPLYEEKGETPLPLKSFLEGFVQAFVFSASQDLTVVERLKEAVPEVKRIVTIPPQGDRQHVSAFRWQQLCAEEPFSPPLLPCSVRRSRQAQALLGSHGWSPGRPLICIHPGSGGAVKCWETEKYAELIALLRKEIQPFFLTLRGPVEEELGTGLQVMGEDIISLSGLGLLKVFSLLSLCNLYVGNDSGISHLAALSGCKTLAVFGPTDPVLWRPRGRRSQIIGPETACAPCGEQARSCKDRRCLSGISVERVLREAVTLLLS